MVSGFSYHYDLVQPPCREPYVAVTQIKPVASPEPLLAPRHTQVLQLRQGVAGVLYSQAGDVRGQTGNSKDSVYSQGFGTKVQFIADQSEIVGCRVGISREGFEGLPGEAIAAGTEQHDKVGHDLSRFPSAFSINPYRKYIPVLLP